jgi:hypothetical protein
VEILLKRCLLSRYVHYKVAGPGESPELLPYVQDLMDGTMLLSPTPKPRAEPSRLVARKVLRNTNMMIYAKYATTRHLLRERRKGQMTRVEVKTQAKAQEMQRFRAANFGGQQTSRLLESDLNEVYLWHGTSYEAVQNIFSDDFIVGHKAHIGLFGRGLYFAESCAKADGYTQLGKHDQSWYCRPGLGGETDSVAHGDSVRAMLLCRVVLGKVKTVQRAGMSFPSVLTEDHGRGEFDSLIGDRDMHRQEFILTSCDAVFPEFGVLYNRDATMRRTGEAAPVPAVEPEVYAI